MKKLLGLFQTFTFICAVLLMKYRYEATRFIIKTKNRYYEEAKITCKQMIDNLHLVPEYEHERIKVNYEVFSKLTS